MSKAVQDPARLSFPQWLEQVFKSMPIRPHHRGRHCTSVLPPPRHLKEGRNQDPGRGRHASQCCNSSKVLEVASREAHRGPTFTPVQEHSASLQTNWCTLLLIKTRSLHHMAAWGRGMSSEGPREVVLCLSQVWTPPHLLLVV